MSNSATLLARTSALKNEYSWSINSAIESGRPELASELADSFHSEMADLARDHAAPTDPRGVVYPR